MPDSIRRILVYGHYNETQELITNLHKIIKIICKKFGVTSVEMRIVVPFLRNLYQLTGNVKKSLKSCVMKNKN